jgi:periplasmic protein TonB
MGISVYPRFLAASAAVLSLMCAVVPGATELGGAPDTPRAAEAGHDSSFKKTLTKTAPKIWMNAYFASDFKDTAYQNAAVQLVLKSWKPSGPLPQPGKKTVVISTIGRDGKLRESRIHLESGKPAFDAAAMAAVRKAVFQPLPKSYPGTSVEVHWHFNVAG